MELGWLLACPLVASICFSVIQNEKEKLVCEPVKTDSGNRNCMSCLDKMICPSKRLSWRTCAHYVTQHSKVGGLRLKKRYKNCTSLEQDLERAIEKNMITKPNSHDKGSTQLNYKSLTGSDNASGDQNQSSRGVGEQGMNLQSASLPDDLTGDETWNDSLMNKTGMGNDSTKPFISDVKIQITIIPKGVEDSSPIAGNSSAMSPSTSAASNPVTTTTLSTIQATTATTATTASTPETTVTVPSFNNNNSSYLEGETRPEQDFSNGTENKTVSSFYGLNARSSARKIRPKAPQSSLLDKEAENYFNDTGMIQHRDHMRYDDLNGSSIRINYLVQNASSIPHYMDQRVEFDLALFEYSLAIVWPFVGIAIVACCCKIKLKKRCNPTYWIRRYCCDVSSGDDDEDSDQEEESPV